EQPPAPAGHERPARQPQRERGPGPRPAPDPPGRLADRRRRRRRPRRDHHLGAGGPRRALHEGHLGARQPRAVDPARRRGRPRRPGALRPPRRRLPRPRRPHARGPVAGVGGQPGGWTGRPGARVPDVPALRLLRAPALDPRGLVERGRARGRPRRRGGGHRRDPHVLRPVPGRRGLVRRPRRDDRGAPRRAPGGDADRAGQPLAADPDADPHPAPPRVRPVVRHDRDGRLARPSRRGGRRLRAPAHPAHHRRGRGALRGGVGGVPEGVAAPRDRPRGAAGDPDRRRPRRPRPVHRLGGRAARAVGPLV
ncbi:MAG: putative SimX4 homolog, partial [uncultured Actinomycetospora sp.]